MGGTIYGNTVDLAGFTRTTIENASNACTLAVDSTHNYPYGTDATAGTVTAGTVCRSLAADFGTTTTTNPGAATNLTFAVAATDEWFIEVSGLLTNSGSNGNGLSVSIPTGATIVGGIQGCSSTANTFQGSAITAGAMLATGYATSTANVPFRLYARVKMDGVHAGSITINLAAVTSGTATMKAGTVLRAWQVTADL